MVARDIALSRLTGAPVHFLHMSTAGSVDLIAGPRRRACRSPPRRRRITCCSPMPSWPVTTGLQGQPPLRTDEDVAAVIAGLCDGTIDAVATDHAPHAPEAKDIPFNEAPPGMLGLQTALPIAWEVLSPRIGPERVFALLSTQPAVIAELTPQRTRVAGGHSAQGGAVEAGATANLCVFDPARTTVVDPAGLASRSRNTPYAGRTFAGAVRHTVLRGEPVVIDADGAAMSACADRRRRQAAGAVGDRRRRGVLRRGRRRAPAARGDGRARLQHRHERYQEVITDPSYAGQVIAFTEHPHRQLRDERRRRRGAPSAVPGGRRARPRRRAVELAGHRGHRAVPRRHGIPALTGVDTRRLARHVRGGRGPVRVRTAARGRAARAAAAAVGTDGMDLVSGVTTSEAASTRRGDGAGTCASWPTTSGSRPPWSSCSRRSGP